MTVRYICDRCGDDDNIFMRSIETAPLARASYSAPLPTVGHLCGACHTLLHLFMELDCCGAHVDLVPNPAIHAKDHREAEL